MPRFENEDFDPKKRNREDIDRTVPKDEDYYNYSPEDIDLSFNSKKREDNIVVDNQRKPGNYGDYQQDSRGDITFKSETIDDFDRGSSSYQETQEALLTSQTAAVSAHLAEKILKKATVIIRQTKIKSIKAKTEKRLNLF